MPQQLKEQVSTIGSEISRLEQCMALTESLVSGNPMSEAKVSGNTISSDRLTEYRERITALMNHLADINQRLTVL